MLAAEQTYSQEVLLLWKQLVVCQCPQCVFCCLCTTCDLSKDPHTYTYIHTAGRHTQVPTIQTENSAPLHMTPSLSISDFVIHSYTHTRTYKENNQMLVPPQQPTPLHQQLLPQQQVSRHPPPAVFCQRWNTGVFKPWTQAKHAHTHTHAESSRRPGLQRWWQKILLWVCSCVCPPCCVDSHNILWMSGWRRV